MTTEARLHLTATKAPLRSGAGKTSQPNHGDRNRTEKIKAIAIRPKEKPEVIEIDDELKAYQEFVGGYIQVEYPWPDTVGIVCNDEGKMNGMQPNRALYDDEGEMYDIVCGPFLIVGLEDEGFASLTDEQIEKFTKRFASPEAFVRINGTVLAIPF